jgi:hypothetical protein
MYNYNSISNSILLLVFIVLNINGFGQVNKKITFENYNDKAKIQSENPIILDSLKRNIDEIKKHYENTTLLIQTANTYIQYSSGLIALIAILVTFFSFMNYNRAQKVTKEAENKIFELDKKFNEFINSPEKINTALEIMNKSLAEKLIFSNKLSDFNEGISIAYRLNRNIRIDISKRIIDKIYNPNIDLNYFVAIYSFLIFNLEEDFRISIPQIINLIKEEIFNQYKYVLLNEVFGKQPMIIEPTKFLKETKRDKNLIVNFLIGVLNDEGIEKLLIFTLEEKYDIDYRQIAGRLKKDELTQKVSILLDKISNEILDQIKLYLDFSPAIAKRIFETNNESKDIDQYLLTSIINGDNFKGFIDVIDLKNEKTWINLIKAYFSNFDNTERMTILKFKYEELKNDLPKNEFFDTILPLLFEKNYGVKKVGFVATFNDKPLILYKDKPFFLPGPDRDTVNHPVLKIQVFL